MTIPQEAIEAATQALSIHWKAPHTNEALGRQRALAEHALTAALPALEQQIREEVAEEIRAYLDGFNSHGLPYRDGVYAGINSAAKIALGKDQP